MNAKINTVDDLPKVIPVVPLYGAVLLPRAQIPLPLNEEEYLGLTADFFRHHVYVGVAQPMLMRSKLETTLPLYRAGSLGKVIDVEEVEDDKLVLTLEGICRFDIMQEELVPNQVYRRAMVNYEKYQQDLTKQDSDQIQFDRSRLLQALDGYFKQFNLKPNWEEIGDTTSERLISSLAMLCPLEASEKQAVLEAPTLFEQTEMLTKLIEIGLIESRYYQNTATLSTFH